MTNHPRIPPVIRLDNIDIAILTKLNALAERYGLKAYEFLASVRAGEEGITTLSFDSLVNDKKEESYDEMLNALHIKNGQLKGRDSSIIEALDAALHLAPKLRQRS